MNITAGARTDSGARDNNEDSLAVLTNHQGNLRADCIMIIADGMGGRAYGERASASAVESIRATLAELLSVSAAEKPPIQDALATALRRANSLVYDLAAVNPGRQPMGTTCTTAVIAEDKLFIAHVGDSRAYLLRDDILRAITTDHSFVAEQMRAGHLSDHDARRSRFKNVITKAVGIEPTLQPDIDGHALREGDAVLLCTDGLTGTIDEAGITQIVLQSRDPQTTCDYLVEAAKRAGAKDNISVIAVYVGEPAFIPTAKTKEPLRTPKNVDGPARRPRPPRLPVKASSPKAVEKASGSERAERFLNETATDAPEGRARVASPVLLLLAGLLLGAVVALASLIGGHIVRVTSSPPYFAPFIKSAAKPVVVDLSTVGYMAPSPILYKPLRTDFLQATDGGYLVATQQGRLLLVNPAGQIARTYPGPLGVAAPPTPTSVPANSSVTAAPPADATVVPPVGIVADQQGDLYRSDPAKRSIDKYRPDGSFLRTIGAGELANPGALTVAVNGDIFVVDNGRLVIVRARPTVPSAVPAGSPGRS
ncbi:MAG TPA: protein phosphatase 2C domain-containing protein [Capsulimonadaceae bacterium]|nr:protein phosphatase 2C domain-containing protein [Capsulimonadaceae bacterium]